VFGGCGEVEIPFVFGYMKASRSRVAAEDHAVGYSGKPASDLALLFGLYGTPRLRVVVVVNGQVPAELDRQLDYLGEVQADESAGDDLDDLIEAVFVGQLAIGIGRLIAHITLLLILVSPSR